MCLLSVFDRGASFKRGLYDIPSLLVVRDEMTNVTPRGLSARGPQDQLSVVLVYSLGAGPL